MGTYFKLDEILDELGITPNKLAERANLRPDTVYKIYRNQIKRPHIDVLDDLIEALNDLRVEKKINKKFHIHDIIDYK